MPYVVLGVGDAVLHLKIKAYVFRMRHYYFKTGNLSGKGQNCPLIFCKSAYS